MRASAYRFRRVQHPGFRKPGPAVPVLSDGCHARHHACLHLVHVDHTDSRKKVLLKEALLKKFSQKEITQEEISQKEITQKGISQKEVLLKKVI